MLSSTVATVLAPLRGGRCRRKGQENGSSEGQYGTNATLEPWKQTLTNGHRGQLRTPFSSTRQNMVACGTEVDHQSRSKMTPAVSLDVSSAGVGKREAASGGPAPALEHDAQRTGPQALLAAPSWSLKPTSSSLLLYLRRSNAHVMNATQDPALSEKHRLSQRNAQAAPGPDSPPTGDGPVRPPSSSRPNPTASFRAQLPSDSSISEGAAAAPPAQAEIPAGSWCRRVPYDRPPLPKAPPVPRGTTLRSTSWWKQVPAPPLKPTGSERVAERYSSYPGADAPSRRAVPPTSAKASAAGAAASPEPPPSLPGRSDASLSSEAAALPPAPRRPPVLNASPLGFQRSYASIPFHPKPASALIPTVGVYPKTNCGHVTRAPPRSPPTAVCGASTPPPLRLSPPPPPLPSCLLTPPATPVASSPSCPDSSGPGQERTLSSGQEKESGSKNPGAEGKKARRVTWEESVDVQQSQKVRADTAERGHLPAEAPPSRASVKAPSTFSLLRQSHPASRFGSQTPKISSILAGKEGKYRSLSSDSADLASRPGGASEHTPSGGVVSHQGRLEPAPSRRERTLSLGSGTAQRPSSASLYLPPELSGGYKLRYSSPPYTALMSNRTAPRSAPPPAASQPGHRRPCPHNEPVAASPAGNAAQSPVGPPHLPPLPFQTSANAADRDNFNCNSHGAQKGQVSALSGTGWVGGFPSAFITETLVYSIQAKAAPKITPNPANAPPSAESRPSPTGGRTPEDERSERAPREALLGKSRCVSVESSQEQIQKKSRLALKRSTSSPSSSLCEGSNRTATKMDHMVSKLKKAFGGRRSEDDPASSWKWRRTSPTPSASSGADGPRSAARQEEEEEEEEGEEELPAKGQEEESRDTCAPIRCTLTPPAPRVGGGCAAWPGGALPPDGGRGSASAEQMCVNRPHSPSPRQLDGQPSNRFLSSPAGGPVSPAAYPAHPGRSTPSPRSPFSPFSSLSPVSSVPSPDVTDDVFYSPKPARRREPGSPCEPGEGFSLTGSRRSRASTGPPSPTLSPENGYSASSCADLKYGIEPGRSYSVSSVLSSRPSGPGRISRGSRVMSVGSLCESALTYAGHSQDLDLGRDLGLECEGPLWAVGSGWGTRKGFQAYCAKDGNKARSRSLPRSLTRCLSSWTSGVPPPSALTVPPAHLVDPGLGGSHFPWDAEGPPTPPPTPPPSPPARRMSKPPSPSTPESPQRLDGLSGGHLAPRGHQRSLGTFDESSDNSSETTTDDEYYLGTGEEEEKETEL